MMSVPRARSRSAASTTSNTRSPTTTTRGRWGAGRRCGRGRASGRGRGSDGAGRVGGVGRAGIAPRIRRAARYDGTSRRDSPHRARRHGTRRSSPRPARRETAMTSPSDGLDLLAVNTIRTLSIDGVQQANWGRRAPPWARPRWPTPSGRATSATPRRTPPGRTATGSVLSAGHASMLLYSLLRLTGYAVSLEDLESFRQWGSITPGHPEFGMTSGVEARATATFARGWSTAWAWPSRSAGWRPSSTAPATTSSTIAHTSSAPTATSGGHHRRGQLPRRPPAAGQVHRPLRRQPDPARRPHRLDVHRGRARPVRRVRLAHPAHRGRERRRSDLRRHRGGEGGRPAVDHRGPHPHRVRQPEQAGHRRSPMAPRWARTRSA